MPASKSRLNSHDVHFTREFKRRLISSLSESIREAVICSPYFDKLPAPFFDIVGFCRFLRRRGTDSITVVTRPPNADKQALTLEMARRLDTDGMRLIIKPSPYLHAKLYHFEYEKGYFRTFIGSSNFTMGGFERNYEIVTELVGVGDDSACHREIARLTNTGSLTYNVWASKGLPRGAEETP